MFKTCYKKEVSDAVDFLHADKHEGLLKIDTKKKYAEAFLKFPK